MSWLTVVLTLFAATGDAGGIKGKISFAGKAPAPQDVKMYADPKCLQAHPKGMKYQPVSVDKKGGLSDAFVYVKVGLEGKKFNPPTEPKTVLDQKGCWYMPRVLGLQVGQPLVVLNSDPTMHNVNAQPEFNIGMPPGMKATKVFKKPQVMATLKCNVHPWMYGYIGVLEHPFYAVTNADGSFEIKDLEPGKYVIEAWHEKLGTISKEIDVPAAGATLDLKFQAKAKS